MGPRLPPPDPNEPARDGPAAGPWLPAPTAVFLGDEPSPENDRVSDAILDLRPGLLVVCARH